MLWNASTVSSRGATITFNLFFESMFFPQVPLFFCIFLNTFHECSSSTDPSLRNSWLLLCTAPPGVFGNSAAEPGELLYPLWGGGDASLSLVLQIPAGGTLFVWWLEPVYCEVGQSALLAYTWSLCHYPHLRFCPSHIAHASVTNCVGT